MAWLDAIKNLLGLVAETIGLIRSRDAEKNAPDVQKAAAAQKEQAAEDQTRKAIANRDTKEIQRELAE